MWKPSPCLSQQPLAVIVAVSVKVLEVGTIGGLGRTDYYQTLNISQSSGPTKRLKDED